jgi:hypothetical protein
VATGPFKAFVTIRHSASLSVKGHTAVDLFKERFVIEYKEVSKVPFSDPVQVDPKAKAAKDAIAAKYLSLGAETGFLGAPVGFEGGNSTGFYQRYNGGWIFWSEQTGAFEVHGDILAKFLSLGLGAGLLGFPLTDETGTPDGIGRYNHFANGSIYWTPQTGAFEVHGPIRDKWASLGWEKSYLGYPISDVHEGSTSPAYLLEVPGLISNFQNGSIEWSQQFGARGVPQVVSVNLPDIKFGPGLPVGGNAVMVLSSDGTSTFEGHLHDSGFPSFDYLIVLTIKGTDSVAYSCSQGGHLHGTDESGSRDDSWNQTVINDQVRDNWSAIRDGQSGHSVSITSDFSPKAIFDEIVATLGTVLGVVGIIVALPMGGSSKPDPYAPNGPSGPGNPQ